jgi:hypothetical protein
MPLSMYFEISVAFELEESQTNYVQAQLNLSFTVIGRENGTVCIRYGALSRQ